MRSTYLTLTCLWLAACGDNRAFTPLDGAPMDTPPDTAPPVKSRVWFFGDFLAEGDELIGGITHGEGTLPFGLGNEPPIKIANAKELDARGAKIAYVVRTATGEDLYVADADGARPVMLVQGMPNVEINGVALSPDGTKVAYTTDSVVNNGFDLHVMGTTAGAISVKVSPDRPMMGGTDEQDVSDVVTWSADSKYLAFAADLTENTFDQAYVVDTTAVTPTAVELLRRSDIAGQTTGARGVRGALQFDAMNNIYFRARTVADGQFQLFRADPSGFASRIVFALPTRTGGATPGAGAFAISPDGTKIVFSADAPTLERYNLFVSPVVNPTPTQLTMVASPGNANFDEPMVFSPDGTKIAMVADFLAGDNNDEPFVVHLDGTTQTPRRLVNVVANCVPPPGPPMCSGVDVESVQWTADGTTIYIRGDITSQDDERVFRVDPTRTDQAPILVVTTPANGDVTSMQVREIP